MLRGTDQPASNPESGPTLKILFGTEQPFLPHIIGGMEVSTFQLSVELKALGHDAAVMCGVVPGGPAWLWTKIASRMRSGKFLRDSFDGLRVYRGTDFRRGPEAVISEYAPDKVIIQGGTTGALDLAARVASCGHDTYFHVHDLAPLADPSRIPVMKGVRWIANSDFSARVLREGLGVTAPVVPPCISFSEYEMQSSGDCVTMINPRPLKGGGLAIDIAAACPDIPFLFVEAWSGAEKSVQLLKRRAGQLPNITWLPRQSDMRSVYARTRLLLVPSQCPETWCRVVTEGQMARIPAVASDAGAIPDTLGQGGSIVPQHARLEDWVTAVRRLWQNAAAWKEASRLAWEFGQRPEIQPNNVAAQFVRVIGSAPGS